MSLLEGGDFKCYTHNFSTNKPAEWNEHCLETAHTQSGFAPCVYCGMQTEFKNEPYVTVGQARFIVCKKCEAAQSSAKGKKK